MSNKVKLPKAVCDALEDAESRFTIATIIREIDIDNSKWVGSLLASQDVNLIIRALVLGYEPEMTAEEQIKDLYFLNIDFDTPYFRGFREGVSNALKIHGIKYDWLEDGLE